MRSFYYHRKLIFLIIVISLVGLILRGSYFDEAIIGYVENQSLTYFEQVVSEVFDESLLPLLKDDIINVAYLEDGSLSTIQLNTYQATKIRTKASSLVQDVKTKLSQTELLKVKIPFGYFFTKLSFLSDGLTLPVKLSVYQAYEVSIISNVRSSGINNSLFEVSLLIRLDTLIQIPLQTKRVELVKSTLLSSLMFSGKVPSIYGFD